MLNAIDKKVLKEVADLEGMPKGAYNIRKNGKLEGREVSANINIETNEKGDGIIIDIKPGTKDESVHIPVILSQAGLHDVVYNTFIIGEGSDVTIVAGCGIHCGGNASEGHSGIHEFQIKAGAKVKYVEKHIAIGEGSGKRILNPTTKVFMEENAQAQMELTQIGGVDEAKRVNEATIGAGSVLLITERVMTEKEQSAESRNEITLAGTDSKTNIVSRSVIKGSSSQDFYVNLTAKAKCYGHIECDAIIMDNGINQTIPALRALHPDAELTHEASIGKIANDQLMKLMSLGLDYDQAVNRIIQGFLR
ncbi:SufB/SufD family protein [Desulfotignum phosphitoxidans]|uniref:FeS cluster assembly protein SufBD n=2 Tax=Desulfotignum TaxID=115780 RepID=S0G092_9BACT|nr:SufD family Fe-S cluster assembly protein [Desulfotignum phosphitoxidans]EMS80320.1 FeS cluster assembly protein SufBD [Desulfotignum phosphitoxidans DSM 13687]